MRRAFPSARTTLFTHSLISFTAFDKAVPGVDEHLAAERRLKRSILEGKDYPGKQADLELIRRKHHELSQEKLRQVGETIAEGGGGGRG